MLTGAANYVADLEQATALHAAFVRSPHAHAHVRAIDTTAARAMPGVVAVFTADDLGLPAVLGFESMSPSMARPPLAVDKVRFVGEAVALVVAESLGAATDAAELVDVDYEPLDAAVDPQLASAAGRSLAVRRHREQHRVQPARRRERGRCARGCRRRSARLFRTSAAVGVADGDQRRAGRAAHRRHDHPARVRAGCAHSARRDRTGARPADRRGTGRRAARRRWLRCEVSRVQRVLRARGGGSCRRPSGALDRDAHRASLGCFARPRPDAARGDGIHPRRQDRRRGRAVVG